MSSVPLFRSCKRIRIGIGFILISIAVYGRVLIVSQDGTGDFLTIGEAATEALAGDTVSIRAGIYYEMVEPCNSGTPEQWILYRNHTGDDVIVHGGDGDRDCCVRMMDVSFIRFTGLVLRGGLYAGIFAEGPVDHVTIDECVVEDNIHPEYGAGYGIWFMAWDAPISECTISRCIVRNNSSHGIFLYRRNYDILIHDNEVSYSGLDGDDWGHNVKAVVWNEHDPQTGPRRITITDNNLHHARTQGIMTWNAGELLIRGNHCHHNGATGIQIEDGTRYFVIEENTCEWNQQHYSTETGIWVDDADHGIVQRNIIRHNQVGIKVSKSRDIIVRRNLVYKNSRENTGHAHNGGIFLLAYDGIRNERITVVHNTFSEIGNPFYTNTGFGLYEYYGAVIESTLFMNNILSETKTGFELSMQAVNPAGAYESDYNNFHNSNGISVNWQGIELTWDEYQRISGRDTASFTIWPSFVDTSQNNYRLAGSSPCIDAAGILTRAKGPGAGSVIPLESVRFFSDGYDIIPGDSIVIGSHPPVEIISVDDKDDTITISTPLYWSGGDPVQYRHMGSAPDMGALESTSAHLTVFVNLDQGFLNLHWSAVSGAHGYWVYGAENNTTFIPGMGPAYGYRLATLPPFQTEWSSDKGIGDAQSNWTYLVMAVDWSKQEVARSRYMGESDFSCEIPSANPAD